MKILVTGLVPRAGLNELYAEFDVVYSEGKPFSREEVLKMLPEMNGVLLTGEKADKEFIDLGANLKVIAVNGVGFDNVDVEYAREKSIYVCNSPKAVQEPTAELTFCLLLAAARRLRFYDENLRKGIWANVSVEAEMGFAAYGSTLGIVGMGRIGQSVARRAKVFGMKVLYFDQVSLPGELEEEFGARKVGFDELLKESDIVTIHTPLLDSTHHLFSTEEFSKMKSTAFIVNAARGPIIDEKALVHALSNNIIAGAGLDVFEFEPEISKEMLGLDNVIMTPHAGTGCLSSRTILAGESAGNIIAVLKHNKPINVVNNLK